MARLALDVWLVHFNKTMSLQLGSDGQVLLQREMGQSCSFKHVHVPLGTITRSLAAPLLRAKLYLKRVKAPASAPLTRSAGTSVQVSHRLSGESGSPAVGWGLSKGCQGQQSQCTVSMSFPGASGWEQLLWQSCFLKHNWEWGWQNPTL